MLDYFIYCVLHNRFYQDGRGVLVSINLYKDTNEYKCHSFINREKWLEGRTIGIGGSDVSVLVGKNPYKTQNELWKEKKGIIKSKELISAAIEHGNRLEPVIRHWFKASFPQFEVQYQENIILQSKEREWMLYSPDGLLFHEEMGKGIFEAKTTLIQNAIMLENWNNQIPVQYYCQVLHGLLVTKFDFVILVAEIRFAWNEDKIEIRKYIIKKEEVLDDLEWLMNEEERNYREFYIGDKEPPIIINL